MLTSLFIWEWTIRRSTLSDANERRQSAVVGAIMLVYAKHCESLSDSRLGKPDIKCLYAMDSTTITLFKDILKGCGRIPKEGKRKGGIKAHTMIDLNYNIPCLIRYTEAARHDHVLGSPAKPCVYVKTVASLKRKKFMFVMLLKRYSERLYFGIERFGRSIGRAVNCKPKISFCLLIAIEFAIAGQTRRFAPTRSSPP
ncbi:MAG: hypothetical protein LBI60_01695 [Bacteroidales bacterium]|jgi:hypothetical protein|nr:hypothetical protein [Bacteroidales bacterium]